MHGVELTDPVFLVQRRVLSGLGTPLGVELSPSLAHPPHTRKKGPWRIARMLFRFLEGPVAESAPFPRPSFTSYNSSSSSLASLA